MPAHRHPKHSRGPDKVGRLPLGTPSVGADNTQLTTSRSIQRSNSSHSSRPDNTSELETLVPASDSLGTADMPITMPEDMSLAEAKLRRQQERAQRLESLMHPPSLGDKTSRAKVKNADKAPEPIRHSERASSSGDGGVGVEVRINTYTAASRDTSLSRSLSSLSQQTTFSHQTAGTGSFDMKRPDSAHDTAGFQMYSRQSGIKRAPTEQSAFAGKPAEKPKTVEANYDEHEILEVFKKHLPGLDYLTTSPGEADGEVQFVQHPNGDVSAHMWSMRSYEWCNIGSFSNIRKKVEGQLAGDRLKGETAYQKLQQNTLTYFRVLAKQREAGVMGYSFGQEDIKQALPELRKPQTAAPSVKSAEEQTNSCSETPSGMNSLRGLPTDPRLDRPAFPQVMHPQVKSDDPFSSSSQKPNPFQGIGSQSSTFGLMGTLSATPTGFTANTGKTTAGPSFLSAKPHISYGQYTSAVSGQRPVRVSSIQPTAKPYMPPRVVGTANADTEHKQSYFDQSTPTSHSRSPRSRELRLSHLREIQENAMKRSQSQTDITRTVLNDPLRAIEDSEYDESVPDVTSCADSEVYEPLPRDPQADFEEMCQGWTDTQPRIETTERKTSALTLGSVPDTDYQPPAVQSTHMSPQELRAADRKVKEEGHEKSLREWWTGGNKFARQDEFYRHIMATANTQQTTRTPSSTVRHTSFGTPSVRPRPIGAPAITSTPPSLFKNATTPSKPAASQYNDQMTRILIPVYENLASYVQGPADKRRDYWCRWVQPPEWCIDRSPNGNASFFDNAYHKPPERVGRDPRYAGFPGELKFGGFSPQSAGVIGGPVGYSSGASGFGRYAVGGSGRYSFGGNRY